MASKKQQLSGDELLAQLDELSVENTTTNNNPSSSPAAGSQTPTITTTMTNTNNAADAPTSTSPSTSPPAPSAANANPTAKVGTGEQSGNDIIAELSNLAAVRPSSRTTNKSSVDSAAASTRVSTDEKRASATNTGGAGDAANTGNTATSATAEKSEDDQAKKDQSNNGNGGSSSWFGGIFATASAAVKQAEAAVKDIQNNEEAQKWTEQVKGRVGGLRGLGDELRTLAMPTFTSLIHTLAPPISAHERLQIHAAHDFHGYPSLDPLIYSVFSRIMSQVEGGDLMVIQRSQEAPPPVSSTGASSSTDRKRAISSTSRTSTAGWNDGPWWRTVVPGESRCINSVKGSAIATKLARANAEDYAKEYFTARGGVELVKKHAAEAASASNPVRTSDIFVAIQAIDQSVSNELFQANRQGETDTSVTTDASKSKQETSDDKDDSDDDSANREVSFAIYLHDPIHNINFSTISQPIPQKWIEWFDSPAPPANLFSEEDDNAEDTPPPFMSAVPDDILEIIEQGGVDPREWASEWLQETISLAVGIVAQRYVARRMGVGEPRSSASGSEPRKDKMKAGQAPVLDSGAGEAARAL